MPGSIVVELVRDGQVVGVWEVQPNADVEASLALGATIRVRYEPDGLPDDLTLDDELTEPPQNSRLKQAVANAVKSALTSDQEETLVPRKAPPAPPTDDFPTVLDDDSTMGDRTVLIGLDRTDDPTVLEGDAESIRRMKERAKSEARTNRRFGKARHPSKQEPEELPGPERKPLQPLRPETEELPLDD